MRVMQHNVLWLVACKDRRETADLVCHDSSHAGGHLAPAGPRSGLGDSKCATRTGTFSCSVVSNHRLMSGKRRLLLVLLGAVGLAVGFLVVRQLRTPSPTIPKQPPPPPAVERRKPALQADAPGQYLPGYRFSVGRFRFTGFSLRPDALVTFDQSTSGTEDAAACLEATITPVRIHLRCEYPQVGIVTVEGRFLTRLATNRLDTPVVSAVVTVRAASGEVLYSARDSFVWEPGR